jgi:NADH:ubiquinone oxidoreductase subunit 6 (subunit J)
MCRELVPLQGGYLFTIASQRTGIFVFMTLGTSNVAFSLILICALKWLMCCSCVISSEFVTMDGDFLSPCKVVVYVETMVECFH